MSKAYIMIRSNPIAGCEARYNEWYDTVHLPEVLQVDGVLAYQRFALTKDQLNDEPQSHQYLIQLEIDGNDIAGTVARLYAALPQMTMEPVVDHDVLKMSIVQPVTDVVRKR